MANICENTMYVSSPNKESLQQIHEFMNNWGNVISEEIEKDSGVASLIILKSVFIIQLMKC